MTNSKKFLRMNFFILVASYKVRIQTEFAIKMVQGFGQRCDFESQIRQREREYRTVISLDNHPRIIQYFGFAIDVHMRLMIIMEYLYGCSMADKMKNQKPLSNYYSHKYLKQILEAVDFLHRRNVIHNNIKPANILFNVKADFGFAVGIDWQTASITTSSHIEADDIFIIGLLSE